MLASFLIVSPLGAADPTAAGFRLGSAEPRDFVEYWAAARLFLNGGNPYSPEELLQIERGAGWSAGEALVMWNPPWTLPFLLPLGYLSFSTAQAFWLLLQICALLIAGHIWAQICGSERQSTRLCWIITFTFVPSVFVLVIGQITPLAALGGAYFVRSAQKQKYWLASGALLLLMIKPHLLYLFWLMLVIWIIDGQRWALAKNALILGAAAALLPLSLDAQIYSKYLALYADPNAIRPLEWPAPTLRNALRILLAVDSTILQFAPTAAASIWALWHWHRHKNHWRWDEQFPLLAAVSVAAGFFVWTYDLVVLLPALCQAAVWISRSSVPWHRFWTVRIYLGINLLHAFLRFRLSEDLWYVWLAPALLINYLIFRRERCRYSSDLRFDRQ